MIDFDPMATGEARAMLDALMGPDRDTYIPNISRFGLDKNASDLAKLQAGQSKRKKSCFDRDGKERFYELI